MSQPATHIIRNVGPDKSELIRASDGMVIACRQGHGVIFGEDPNLNQGTRVFMDDTYAKMFLRKLADIDINTPVESKLRERVARIDEMEQGRTGKSTITIAN